MAERLLGALAKGTYKAVAEPAKQAVQQAIDPKIMRSVFSAGLIGPLIRSIVSEYDKKDESSQNNKPQVISSDLSRGLEAMSSQLSTLASIMDDIRELTKNQLMVDKDQFNKTLRQTQKSNLQSIEDKMEGKKPSVSSLADSSKKDAKNKSIFSSLFDFAKDNPILSALLVGTVTFFSKELQLFFKGVLEGSGFDKIAKESITRLRDGVASNIKNMFKDIGIGIDTSFASILTPAAIGAFLGAILPGKRFGITTKTGAAAGLGVGIGQDVAGEGDAFYNNPLVQAFLGLAGASLAGKGIGKITDRIFKKSPPIFSAPAAGAGAAVGPAMAGTAASVANDKKLTPLERSKLYASRQTTVSGASPVKLSAMLSKAIKKVSFTGVMTFIKVRLGVATLGTLIGGPFVGLLLVLLTMGPLAFDLLQELLDSSDTLDDADRATGGDRGLDFSPEGVPIIRDVLSVGPDGVPTRRPSPISSMGSASEPVRPPISSFNLNEYEAKVIATESAGQNRKNDKSSAFGLYQITDETFKRLQNKYKELNNFTKEDFNTKPEVQQLFFRALTESNREDLTRANLPVDEKNLYLAHRFGSGDAKSMLEAYEQGRGNEQLSEILPKSFEKIMKQNSDITKNTTLAGALLGAYSKMDKNVQMNAKNITPDKNPLMNVGIIGELSKFYQMATGQPLVINNNQSSSVMSSGGGGDNRPGAQPVHAPISGEQDRLRDMLYLYPRGMLT